MDTKFKLFLTIIGILLIGNVLASTNFTITQNVTVTIIEPTIIGNETYLPHCAFERENITFYADVSGPCTEEVIFSINTNGTWENFTGQETENGLRDYFYEIYSCTITQDSLQWIVYAKDCYGYTYNGSFNEFYIYPITRLTTIPSEPDGENFWFLSPPKFILENPNATKIFYKWGLNKIYLYSGEFGMENSPILNEGGATDLNYWGEMLCDNESIRKELIKLDLSPPEIIDVIPANNSLIHDTTPKIDAKIIDKINKDSGVNPSSVVFRLDGEIETNCNISESYILGDLIIRCIPTEELSDNIHNVRIYAEDNAGRSSEIEWSFEVKKLNYSFELEVYSPHQNIYSEKRIPFNLTADRKINSLEYIDWNSLSPRWTKFCSNCENYGFLNSRFKVFREGLHNITIKGASGLVVEEENQLFMVDTIAPRIHSTKPKSKQIANGLFSVKFEEKNLKQVFLVINNLSIHEVLDCVPNGKYTECSIEVDLSEFEGENIEYYFKVSDFFRESYSKKTKITVE